MNKPCVGFAIALALAGCGNSDSSSTKTDGAAGAPSTDAAAQPKMDTAVAPADTGSSSPDTGNAPAIATLSLAGGRMVIDVQHGARITEFSVGGVNVLSGPEVNKQNFGSTFWPAPQALWNWPPISAFDSAAYTGTFDASTGILRVGSEASGLPAVEGYPRLTITKTFTPLPELDAVDVTYEMTNVTTAALPAVVTAPWQITRVKGTGGLTFFAKGPGAVNAAAGLPLTEAAGCLWFPFAPATADSKTFADAAGWVAHVTAKRQLLVLRYEDIAPGDSPKGDSELELYTGPLDKVGDYVEIEPLGKATTLAAGQSLTWKVRFLLRTLPAEITPTVGDPALLAYVETVK